LDFGDVCKPPHAGVIGLTDWALELWHYINGRCLLNGLDLKELEVSDMLDVVHYLFEEDAVISSEAEFETKNNARDIIYETVYERKFAYSSKKKKDFDEYSSEPFDKDGNYVPSTTNYVKPYIPPTNFDPDASNPYSGVLRETPLG
jgi:hypothetical protein